MSALLPISRDCPYVDDLNNDMLAESERGNSQQFWLHTLYLSVLHCRWIMLALWQNYFQSKSAHLQETVVKVMHENQRTDSNGEIVSLISYHNLFHYSCMKKNVRRPFR